MARHGVVLTLWLLATAIQAADHPLCLTEQYLHEGRLADGERALLLVLDAHPKDDEARFGLGVIQFVRSIENLGRALYEYGAVSEKATQPFLRVPVPKNENPSPISYRALGRVLDAFANDLERAEATLAGIRDDQVKLRLRLSQISLDFSGTGKDRTTLINLLVKLNGGRRFEFQEKNPEFRVYFDRGDVAWLRAYCHLLSAMVEAYRAFDEEPGFAQRMAGIFPKVDVPPGKSDDRNSWSLRVADAPRLRRMRMHLVAVCELNRETWKHIRAETDNDFEWLPHPKQTDQLGLPFDNERINAWLAMMDQWEGLLKGERLLPGVVVSWIHPGHKSGQGLNLRKLLDDPPGDMFNLERLREKGVDARYLEPEKDKPHFNLDAIMAVSRLFDGPFGFASMARMN